MHSALYDGYVEEDETLPSQSSILSHTVGESIGLSISLRKRPLRRPDQDCKDSASRMHVSFAIGGFLQVPLLFRNLLLVLAFLAEENQRYRHQGRGIGVEWPGISYTTTMIVINIRGSDLRVYVRLFF